MGALRNHYSYWIKQHYDLVWRCCFIACCLPALWLLGEWSTGNLGINPLNRLLHFSGTTALVQMLVTLSVTPSRWLAVRLSIVTHQAYGKRLSDWNWLIKLRRQLGLFAFFYALLHLVIYLALDVTWDMRAVWDDIQDRLFILLGFIAFVLLVPLALTANNVSIRWLGSNWRILHRLSYPIVICDVAHYCLQMKAGQTSAWPFALATAVLLAYRLAAWLSQEKDSGIEVEERGVEEREVEERRG
ncbi:protein-methionine-sulfoxide reductase heme-binding subunit MsrQ [Sapientia aquatica]|uniref:Protein-methionine-sulfoxide reductase heme-binding subunit MsrQ n=1 Tax=Sapientia aquatica TaxID=1549640 RepID=A0A4V3AUT5_9BURK|nr:protein-methionine-sulfoxide reductase heme-binding subunit MsrQ [Sapientia aquatica]TDK66450.1 sulfoxide reductase heme-binding subunit YedZ [Sapientia aquatica]